MVQNSLTREKLLIEARAFAEKESLHKEKSLYGITDGKAVGTYLERKFINHLTNRYQITKGNSAKGLDLPDIGVDIKVTSLRQPQSSCPFKTGRQKIYGLGYSLLIFVYNKTDFTESRTTTLDIRHVIFVSKEKTGDYQTTTGILRILKNNPHLEDLLAFFEDHMIPFDSIEAEKVAEELLKRPPEVGYLTISNALQWRLQYGRVIESADTIDGIIRVH